MCFLCSSGDDRLLEERMPGVDCEGEATTFGAKCQPWLQETLAGLASGIRRSENERIFAWVNYTSAGVVSASKLLFTIEQVTSLAHQHPKTFMAIILLPNRAADLRTSPTKNLCRNCVLVLTVAHVA